MQFEFFARQLRIPVLSAAFAAVILCGGCADDGDDDDDHPMTKDAGAAHADAGHDAAHPGAAEAGTHVAIDGGPTRMHDAAAPADGGHGGGKADDAAAGVKDGSTGGGGEDGSTKSDTGTGGGPVTAGSCEGLPPVTDYTKPGPFNDVMMVPGVGPDSNYTLFRPGASLGKDGFKHPIAAWGNGLNTTPDEYQSLLTFIASHGFVIIACNDLVAERPSMDAGMEWLVQQNGSGDLAGKLDTSREVTIGYSWGGGAAIDDANRPNVKATVSLHGMPPREGDAFTAIHSPLLLITSIGDRFVTKDEVVHPNYDQSNSVPTFYAELQDQSVDHIYPLDTSAVDCVTSPEEGVCGDAAVEQGPAVAWLRYWACNDQGAKAYFFGDNCTMCKDPWKAEKKGGSWN